MTAINTELLSEQSLNLLPKDSISAKPFLRLIDGEDYTITVNEVELVIIKANGKLWVLRFNMAEQKLMLFPATKCDFAQAKVVVVLAPPTGSVFLRDYKTSVRLTQF